MIICELVPVLLYLEIFIFSGCFSTLTFGDLYFNDLLNDWSRFDITKRTKHDATISSGLAIMANNRHLYAPNAKIEKPKLNINIAKYNQQGDMSKIIKN